MKFDTPTSVPDHLPSTIDLFREIIVKSMQETLKIWICDALKSKNELAISSGFCQAEDRGGSVRVRTFDRYLNINTLPPFRPKLEAVLNTMNYVIVHDDISRHNRDYLLMLKNILLQTALDSGKA